MVTYFVNTKKVLFWGDSFTTNNPNFKLIIANSAIILKSNVPHVSYANLSTKLSDRRPLSMLSWIVQSVLWLFFQWRQITCFLSPPLEPPGFTMIFMAEVSVYILKLITLIITTTGKLSASQRLRHSAKTKICLSIVRRRFENSVWNSGKFRMSSEGPRSWTDLRYLVALTRSSFTFVQVWSSVIQHLSSKPSVLNARWCGKAIFKMGSKRKWLDGRNPGQVVIGGDSWLERSRVQI